MPKIFAKTRNGFSLYHHHTGLRVPGDLGEMEVEDWQAKTLREDVGIDVFDEMPDDAPEPASEPESEPESAEAPAADDGADDSPPPLLDAPEPASEPESAEAAPEAVEEEDTKPSTRKRRKARK